MKARPGAAIVGAFVAGVLLGAVLGWWGPGRRKIDWGTAAEWVTGLGTAVALILTYLLLRHEIQARQAAEAGEAKKRQDEVARRQLSEIRIMLADLRSEAVAPEKCAELARRIELDRFEISNKDLLDRLHIVRQVAFTLGMDEEAFNRSASSTRPNDPSVCHSTLPKPAFERCAQP